MASVCGDKRRALTDLICVTFSHVSHVYKIISITERGANRQTFPCKDQKTGLTKYITVVDYFKIASAQKVKKLADQEIAHFLRVAAVAPAERRKQICKLYDQNNFSEDSMLKSLGLTIEKNPLKIAGRVLPPPLLHLSHMVEPHDGMWDVRGCRFFQGALIRSWIVVNYNTERVSLSHIRTFIEHLLRLGKGYGMEFNDPMTIQDMPRARIEEHFIYFKRMFPDLQLIIVVLDKNDELYGRLKKIGDIDIGVITQCLQASTVRLCKESTMFGVLLKINAKMGGINNVIANPSSPAIFNHSVMIMGADVNHPSAGDGISPSMAACVASLDRHASMYAVEVMPQDHRVEIIQDLKQMVKNLIMSHRKVQRRWPDKIVMYRDGVSESEFITVLLHEVKSIRQACAEGIQGTTRPTHYHVLWDDNNMAMDELETLTYSMCHLYSRCNKAVSLPTPAYYAHLAAFRAKVHISDLFDQYDGSEGVTKEDIMNAARMDNSHPLSYTMYYSTETELSS
ncbi:Protein argonaute-4 [Portunus trituberculatus]|uniref:Protein argonaute-4 n=1 Tax=Portunus trituberculatus TaxID=210409 RepID=A0A5B7D3C9_PORTR|nr:Protein argonaute-4 [Portunus trituberculatus]